MTSYLHRGVVTTNGRVDSSQEITDDALRVNPVDDALRLPSFSIGNFEWWYFDVIDARNGYVLKLVAHLGTDPLRTTFYPSVVVSAQTPNDTKAVMLPFALEDFTASREMCDVRIKDALHVWVESSGDGLTYHLTVRIPLFSATLQFRSQSAGWKPLGDEVPMQQGRRKAAFSWVVAMPRAEVVGTFCSDGVAYELEAALGYHDHNTWQVGSQAGLFMDQAISYWHWGRFLERDTTVVFMDTHFRTHRLQSCLVTSGETILHSSNNAVEVVTGQERLDATARATYPTQVTVTLADAPGDLHMELIAKTVIDSRDLLDGVSPLLKGLIRCLIARPSYHGILSTQLKVL